MGGQSIKTPTALAVQTPAGRRMSSGPLRSLLDALIGTASVVFEPAGYICFCTSNESKTPMQHTITQQPRLALVTQRQTPYQSGMPSSPLITVPCPLPGCLGPGCPFLFASFDAPPGEGGSAMTVTSNVIPPGGRPLENASSNSFPSLPELGDKAWSFLFDVAEPAQTSRVERIESLIPPQILAVPDELAQEALRQWRWLSSFDDIHHNHTTAHHLTQLRSRHLYTLCSVFEYLDRDRYRVTALNDALSKRLTAGIYDYLSQFISSRAISKGAKESRYVESVAAERCIRNVLQYFTGADDVVFTSCSSENLKLLTPGDDDRAEQSSAISATARSLLTKVMEQTNKAIEVSEERGVPYPPRELLLGKYLCAEVYGRSPGHTHLRSAVQHLAASWPRQTAITRALDEMVDAADAYKHILETMFQGLSTLHGAAAGKFFADRGIPHAFVRLWYDGFLASLGRHLCDSGVALENWAAESGASPILTELSPFVVTSDSQIPAKDYYAIRCIETAARYVQARDRHEDNFDGMRKSQYHRYHELTGTEIAWDWALHPENAYIVFYDAHRRGRLIEAKHIPPFSKQKFTSQDHHAKVIYSA